MKPNYTHIAILLDKSGSMMNISKATIDGFNEFVNSQKSQSGECSIETFQFSDGINSTIFNQDVRGFPSLCTASYVTDGPSTALIDSACEAIDITGKRLAALPEAERPSKVVFVIITDGIENASHKYMKVHLASRIRVQKNDYSWEFVFIGANQDAFLEVGQLGVARGQTINYTANSTGTQHLYASLGKNLSKFRGGQSINMAWEASDIKLQADAKNS